MAITRCLFLFVLLLVAGCAPQVQPPLNSPDGRFTLVTSVEHSRADPITYLCVIFEIQDKSGKVLHAENTHASDVSRWKMRWVSNDRIELDSSDIGMHYWNKQSNGTWEKEQLYSNTQNESIPVTIPNISADVHQSEPIRAPSSPFSAYDAVVVESINYRWHNLIAKNVSTNTGKVVVAFDLRNDGQVANVQIAESTVPAELSELCSKAVAGAGPFEKWPADMRRMIDPGVRQINFTFHFNQKQKLPHQQAGATSQVSYVPVNTAYLVRQVGQKVQVTGILQNAGKGSYSLLTTEGQIDLEGDLEVSTPNNTEFVLEGTLYLQKELNIPEEDKRVSIQTSEQSGQFIPAHYVIFDPVVIRTNAPADLYQRPPVNSEVRWGGSWIGVVAVVSGQTKRALAKPLSTENLLTLLRQPESFVAAHVLLTEAHGEVTTNGSWNGIEVDWKAEGKRIKGPSQDAIIQLWTHFFQNAAYLTNAPRVACIILEGHE